MTMADGALLASAVSGDRAATGVLLGLLRPGVLRYCRTRLGERRHRDSDADDCAQEVLLGVLGAQQRDVVILLSDVARALADRDLAPVFVLVPAPAVRPPLKVLYGRQIQGPKPRRSPVLSPVRRRARQSATIGFAARLWRRRLRCCASATGLVGT